MFGNSDFLTGNMAARRAQTTRSTLLASERVEPDTTGIREIELLEQGDYAAWRNAVFDHTWEARRDSDVLTMPWWDGDNLMTG